MNTNELENYQLRISNIYQIALPYREHELDQSKVKLSRHLAYMAWDRQNERVIITDREEKVLKVFDRNGNIPYSIDSKTHKLTAVLGYNPEALLKCPVAICINSFNDVFVGDHLRNEILVFDSSLDKCLGTFGRGNKPDECINKPSCMDINYENSVESRLYVTDWWSNNITVWLVASESVSNRKRYFGSFLTKLDVISPSSIKVKNNRIVVVSETSWKWFKNKSVENLRQIERIEYGLNCIIILNKTTFQEVNRIQLADSFNPRGLHVTDDNIIYTTVYELDRRPGLNSNKTNQEYKQFETHYFNLKSIDDRKNAINEFLATVYSGRHLSKNMFLYGIGMDGNLKYKVELSFEKIGDFIEIYNSSQHKKRFIFISQRDHTGMHIVDFE